MEAVPVARPMSQIQTQVRLQLQMPRRQGNATHVSHNPPAQLHLVYLT